MFEGLFYTCHAVCMLSLGVVNQTAVLMFIGHLMCDSFYFFQLEIPLDSLRVHVSSVWCMFPGALDDTFQVASITNCPSSVVGESLLF